MENAIRTALHSAFKTLEFKTYDVERVDFLDVLLEDVMDILFPKQPKVSIVTLPTVAEENTEPVVAEEEKTVVVAEPEKKKPGPKPKLDESGNPVARKKPGPKPKEDEPEPEKKKPGPKPKPKPEGPMNIDKLTPTQTKKLKTAAENSKIDFDKNAILAYLNQLSKEDFDAKKLEQHAETYYAGLAEASAQKEDEKREKDMIEIEFQGKTYVVDEATKRVYTQEFDVDGNPTVAVPVGYVGMAAFEEMAPIYEEIIKQN